LGALASVSAKLLAHSARGLLMCKADCPAL